MKKLVLETATGLVINVIVIDADNLGGYQPPDGCELVDVLTAPTNSKSFAGIGWAWDGAQFCEPEQQT